jgi:S1-C subfamily serine protease
MRGLTPFLVLVVVCGCHGLLDVRAANVDGFERHHVAVSVHGAGDRVRVASGIIVGEDGIVVTAAHVARSVDNTASVTAFDGTTYKARIQRVLPGTDLAVLRVSQRWAFALTPLRVDSQPRSGEAVVGLGVGPSGETRLSHGVVRLPVSRKKFRFGPFGFRDPVVLDMKVESGFSGGPVFDGRGQWVGMIVGYQVVRDGDGQVLNTGVGYVLPAGEVLRQVAGIR